MSAHGRSEALIPERASAQGNPVNGLLRPLVVGVLLGAGGALHAAEPRTLDARTGEPRAFGYQVGDLVQRRVWVDLPEGLVLDEASLPKPGARGRALELRALRRTSSGGREALEFEYQVFLSPPAAARSSCRRCCCASTASPACRSCASTPGR